jgi:hypothetical protein
MHRELDIDSLLTEALQQPPDRRAAFLDSRCADDAEVRSTLDRLLREADDRDPFLKAGGAFDGPLWEELLAEPCELVTGALLGPYEIRGPIGAGGMGEVYRAHDPRLGRDVAIKVLPTGAAVTSEALARFEREARAVAALSDPNVVAIHDVGADGDVHFVVTELLEGETLRQLVNGRPLALTKAIDYGVQIARGLAAAHARGIVHRDLKPENIFITREGRVKILDFGIAVYGRARDGTAPGTGARALTREGVLVGTVGYMSPEQVLGEPATSRSDLFAFGVVVHEMLTGIHPFRRATAVETQAAVLREDPVSLGRALPGLAPAIARLVDRCLEKKPDQRPESAHDLALFLEAAGSAGDAGPQAGAGVAAGSAQRVRAPLLAVACGLLLTLTAAIWGYTRVTADRAVDEVVEGDLARAERIARRLYGDQLARLGLTARLVASFPELKALFATDAATIQDFLRGYKQRVAGTPLLVALGRDGTALASTDDGPVQATIGEDWLPTLLATRGEGTLVAIGNRPYLAAAVASEAGGTVFGYLVAAEDVSRAFAEAVSEATQDDVVLLSRQDVLASTLRADQIPWRSLDVWHASGGRADRSVDGRLGTQRFAAREVTLASSPAVSAIIVKSRDDAMGPYLRIQRAVIVIGLLVLVVAVLGVLWISK